MKTTIEVKPEVNTFAAVLAGNLFVWNEKVYVKLGEGRAAKLGRWDDSTDEVRVSAFSEECRVKPVTNLSVTIQS